jgi:hypothetical protein
MSVINLANLAIGGAFFYMLNDSNKEADKLDIFRRRSMDGLNKDTQDIIRLITFSDSIDPVGSFKFKAHKYPGDIDIFEPVKLCCTKDSALNSIVKEIKNIASKVQKSSTVYWGDFKAGYDIRFYIDSENVDNERERTAYIESIYQYLSPSELEKVKTLATDFETDRFYEFVRGLYVVRWTPEEIIAGEKSLRNNGRLSLKDAIKHDTIIKLDLWAPVAGNYNEITNFFLFVWTNEEGEENVLNAELGDRLVSLDHDIKKYSSPDHWKPLKVAKRKWNKALFQNDVSIAKKLAPLFSTGVSHLNQVAGESEVLRFMLTKLDDPPINKLKTQIIGFKRRINDVHDAEFDDAYFYNLIDSIDYDNYDDIVYKLQMLEDKLEIIINDFSADYLKKINML